MALSPHVVMQTEVEPVHVKPVSGTQLVEHPVWFPLSQFSFPTLLLSPHTGLHTEGDPVQVYPVSGIQSVEHPVWFLLSHC